MAKKSLHKRGTFQSFNFSPKGQYEGFLLQVDGETTQINFPQEFSSHLAELGLEGCEIHAEVEPREARDGAAHEVYDLVSLTRDDKKIFPGTGANYLNDGHFAGTVERLNYALHGEVNGGVLDTGDFLHLKPHGAVALDIKVGMKVKGKGTHKLALHGHSVIEAEEVNGIALEHKPKPKKKAHH